MGSGDGLNADGQTMATRSAMWSKNAQRQALRREGNGQWALQEPWRHVHGAEY